jgi:hypothetical protein
MQWLIYTFQYTTISSADCVNAGVASNIAFESEYCNTQYVRPADVL